jgi:AcrR family transcriptional regulator
LKSAAAGKPGGARRRTLDRAAWIGAARGELLRGGIAAVKIGRLARRLGATRGSFYWHFADRDDLLRELLVDWEASNTAPFERILAEGSNGIAEFEAVVELWLAETEYSPAFDTAVRDWARIDPTVAAAVRRADERRIDVLRRIFLDLGFRDPEALVRARITYFHQVGYYTLGLAEEPARRRELTPLYVRALLGRPVAAGPKR